MSSGSSPLTIRTASSSASSAPSSSSDETSASPSGVSGASGSTPGEGSRERLISQVDAATSTVDTSKLETAASAASDLSAVLGDAQKVQDAATALCQDAQQDATLAAACQQLSEALADGQVQRIDHAA